MKRVKIGAAFLNQTPLDWDANLGHLDAALELARQRGVGFLCLPELAISGYGCEDLFLAPHVRERALDCLWKLLPRTKGVFTALGLPLELEGQVYNAMAVCADGQLLGVVPKQILAADGLHYEPRWFKAWTPGRSIRLKLGGRETRVGDLVFKVDQACVGFEICEDAWAGLDRPAPRLSARGANLLLCPAASHFAFGKTRVRRELGEAVSRKHALAYAYSNLMGNESGRVIFDGGAYLLDAQGRLVAEGQRFSYQGVGLCEAVVELRARPVEEGPGLVEAGFHPAEPPLPAAEPVGAAQRWETQPEEELARAVGLGLFDYLRKSHARGFAISLSGGADSAACAVLVRLMAELGSRELGYPAWAKALGDVPGLAGAGGVDQAMPLLLRTLYQASVHSGPVTRAAAQGLAKALGCRHDAVEIQFLVDGYRGMAERLLGRPLRWPDDDLVLQNLQARVRSPGVWALANAEGRLLLATNNRSESAAGYTTMDGDTSGGLAPVAGIGKHFLRQWLRWMEEQGPEGLAPIPALKAVNDQAPTAELRPPEDGQTDEGDLMPYQVLDCLERACVVGRLAPLPAWRLAKASLPGFDAAQLKLWTRRFYQLWSHAQWKRERLALSFHVDDHNVDPRSWCRWPVLSGGFKLELADLEAATD
ncbi:MAG TPA: nitrilase-related carbon-nitrogen hydrolase [bacterium]|nr:nitrilase-related carbon-nitrogen hydrolase [bacterium]